MFAICIQWSPVRFSPMLRISPLVSQIGMRQLPLGAIDQDASVVLHVAVGVAVRRHLEHQELVVRNKVFFFSNFFFFEPEILLSSFFSGQVKNFTVVHFLAHQHQRGQVRVSEHQLVQIFWLWFLILVLVSNYKSLVLKKICTSWTRSYKTFDLTE